MNTNNLKKIGIMGGTFDPIHLGHLAIAEEVREEMNLDKIIFIPTGIPPHKNNEYITSAKHRYAMTLLATIDNPRFETSMLEINRPGKSYTIDTVNQLSNYYKNDVDLYFIIGADSVFHILKWKKSDELLTKCKFVAISRPGYDNEKLKREIDNLYKTYGTSIKVISTMYLNISSTMIRERLKNGKSIKYLVPNAVEDYIRKNKLYNI